MNIGLKLWSTNDFYIDAAKRLHDRHVFDYIELYVVPESLEYLSFWRKLEIPFILHAPHSISGLNPSIEKCEIRNFELIEQVEQYRKALNPEYIVFHPGVDGTAEETVSQFCEMRRKFPEVAGIALVENKPVLGLNEERCVGAEPDEIKYIMEKTGMGFCLDFGHAIAASNSLDISHEKHIDGFMKLNPVLFHLSDGDTAAEMDAHANLGKGNYPLGAIIDKLPPEAEVTLETEKREEQELDDFSYDVFSLLSIRYGMRPGYSFRPVEKRDCRAVWEMANLPDIRSVSFSNEPIPYETHKKWFESKLKDNDVLFLLLSNDGGNIAGQIRFEKKGDDWCISVSLNREFRGKGLGKEIISTGSSIFFDRYRDAAEIQAYIKKDNSASLRSFEKAEYEYLKDISVNKENDALLMVIKR